MSLCPQSVAGRQRLLLLLLLVGCSLPRVALTFLHAASPSSSRQHHHQSRVNVGNSARRGTYTRYRRRTTCGAREEHDAQEEPSSPSASDSSNGHDGVLDAKTAPTAPRETEHDSASAEESSNQERGRALWGWRRKGKRRDNDGVEKGEEEMEREGEGGGREKKVGAFTYDWENGSRVVWTAAKTSSVDLEEGERRLKDYLALPPTEYSLLDPKMITRLSEETFRMDVSTINIVGTKIRPIIFVKVEVQPEQSMANIMVERVELEGSDAVRSAGGSFNVSSSTVVSCAEKEESGRANLTVLRASSDIEIEILVPNENFVPLGVLRRAGNFVMQRIVDIGVPQFTKFLKRDYARWAAGDNDRAAVVLEGEALIEPGDT